ncbi:10031_t:CDS:2, partial [Acaulospora morrowiae]
MEVIFWKIRRSNLGKSLEYEQIARNKKSIRPILTPISDEVVDYFEQINKKGGFGKVYEGFLTKGYIYKWNVEEKRWERTGKKKVALKKLNSEQLNEKFFEEVKRHNEFYVDDHSLMRCYGITKDLTSNKFMIVTTFAEFGTLNQYLKENFKRLTWAEKFKILSSITKGVRHIHEHNYIHKDLHGNNIVMYTKVYPLITDFGECKPVNEKKKDYIEKLIKKCWNKNPNDRPSAQELYEDLYKLSKSLENGNFNSYDDKGDEFSRCINKCRDDDTKIKSLSTNAYSSSTDGINCRDDSNKTKSLSTNAYSISTDDSGQESKPYSVDKEGVSNVS